jgi:hypothetical protein
LGENVVFLTGPELRSTIEADRKKRELVQGSEVEKVYGIEKLPSHEAF